MPKAPILDRELFYTQRPDGSYVMVDWALVNTSLGAMMEPRSFTRLDSPIAQQDLDDVSFNRISLINADQMNDLFGVSGALVPSDYNTR